MSSSLISDLVLSAPYRPCPRRSILPSLVRTLSAEEEALRDEIARRTGLAASAVMRQAMLEKGERMGLHLKAESSKKRK